MNKKNINQLAVVSGFAFTMIVIIGVLVFLGIKVDGWLNMSPLFTIIFSVFGIFAGIYHLIRNVSKLEDQDDKK
jgi:F0F1-type ATP synthase assembly protein I